MSEIDNKYYCNGISCGGKLTGKCERGLQMENQAQAGSLNINEAKRLLSSNQGVDSECVDTNQLNTGRKALETKYGI